MHKAIKDIDLAFVKNYLRLEEDFTEDDLEIELYMLATQDYLCKRLNMTEEKLNESSLLIIPYLMLVADMYSNKCVNISSSSKINPILDRFLVLEDSIV